MNQLILTDPKLYLGNLGHPFCEAIFSGVNKKATCLVDTGFSLGFAFSNKSINRFKYSNGYYITMLLGNGFPTKGMVFSVELLWNANGEQKSLGNTSVVFMEKQGEPLMGIETIRLISPITFDWGNNQISFAS